MPIFNYYAKDGSGRKINGSLDAASSFETVNALRKKGLTVISVNAKTFQTIAKSKPAYGPVKLGQLAVCYRQLATMLEAGVPIVNAIEDIGVQKAPQ